MGKITKKSGWWKDDPQIMEGLTCDEFSKIVFPDHVDLDKWVSMFMYIAIRRGKFVFTFNDLDIIVTEIVAGRESSLKEVPVRRYFMILYKIGGTTMADEFLTAATAIEKKGYIKIKGSCSVIECKIAWIK